jgi:hypothetical protein
MYTLIDCYVPLSTHPSSPGLFPTAPGCEYRQQED